MRSISQKEMDAVVRLDGPARFRHFVKRVVDDGAAWGLWSDGWALMSDDAGRGIFPLWPAREYALAAAVGEWVSYQAEPIPLEELMDDLLPQLSAHGVVPGVFPTPSSRGVTPSIDELRQALRDEKGKYGDC